MIVNEIFNSIDGEGIRAGELATFIRLSGCNMRCSYCDTLYALNPNSGEELDIDEIIQRVEKYKTKNVTLTGGEPLLQDNINDLINILIDHGYSVEIETNGSVDIAPFINGMNRPIFTLDYKLPGSNMENKMNLNNYQYLTKVDVVKFVIGDLEDLNRTKQIIDKYDLSNNVKVYFSPVFDKIEPSVIVDYMIKHHLNNITLQLQLHKFIWDVNKRGV